MISPAGQRGKHREWLADPAKIAYAANLREQCYGAPRLPSKAVERGEHHQFDESGRMSHAGHTLTKSPHGSTSIIRYACSLQRTLLCVPHTTRVGHGRVRGILAERYVDCEIIAAFASEFEVGEAAVWRRPGGKPTA